MSRTVRTRELLVGVEGLALLRHLYDGSDEAAAQRLAEVSRLLDDDDLNDAAPTSEADVRTGYRSWSASYDQPGNPIVALEEPVVRSLVGDVAAGRALDAASGTGRHARHLVERGHDVLGVDVTAEMLEQAAAKAPGARFVEADLRDIPAEDGSFDLVVCGLALAHLAELGPGVTELARVARQSGRLVVSVLHPFQAHLGWHAPFADARGQRGFVREHPHTHADYFAAFTSAGLRVRGCVEPVLDSDHVRTKRRAFRHIPEAALAAWVGLPGVLVWDLEKA
jgi:ubiquinone/menaquinone biosynthesis C-methylase UbiE